MNMMRDETEKEAARIRKTLAKREHYVFYRRDLPEEDQYIKGFVREELCLIERKSDGTIGLGFMTTPYYHRYGVKAMAKLRPNGRYWFISNAYADSLDARFTDAMERLAAGDAGTMKRFDPHDISHIYS